MSDQPAPRVIACLVLVLAALAFAMAWAWKGWRGLIS